MYRYCQELSTHDFRVYSVRFIPFLSHTIHTIHILEDIGLMNLAICLWLERTELVHACHTPIQV